MGTVLLNEEVRLNQKTWHKCLALVSGDQEPLLERDFIQAVEKRGVGAMEIVAMDMKLRGMYMTRQLSFAGVTFDIKELPLLLDFIEMYNDSVKLWIEAREKFEQAAELMGADGRAKKTIWGQFWSAHQVSAIRMIMIIMMTITVIISVVIDVIATNIGNRLPDSACLCWTCMVSMLFSPFTGSPQ
ncbi:protein strawberry notch homolog 1-like [Acropora millepora]|uniref:protein strawberry notch homolog 1-like n=1 Tax=Acropora millepora TaxID=45264 RepID=UPI001CF42C34|nr:protein strawberry notch homolog 1-like [Acropora millepora]